MDVLLDALGYQARQPHQEDVSTSSTDAHKELLAEAGLEVIDCDHGVMNRTGHADNVSLTPRTADRPNRRYRSQATFVFQP